MKDNSELKNLIKEFYPYAKKQLGLSADPKIVLRTDLDNSKDNFGKTAFYSPQEKSIFLYISDRHPKDILRSLSHELVHHKQYCNGQFPEVVNTEEGYAQKDDNLRELEREAYETGNMIFRDYEDSYKKEGNLMESNTQKIEKEISDAKKNRGDPLTKKVREEIQDVFDSRNEKINNELMRRWGYIKKENNDG